MHLLLLLLLLLLILQFFFLCVIVIFTKCLSRRLCKYLTKSRLRALAYNEDARGGFAEGIITRQVPVPCSIPTARCCATST